MLTSRCADEYVSSLVSWQANLDIVPFAVSHHATGSRQAWFLRLLLLRSESYKNLVGKISCSAFLLMIIVLCDKHLFVNHWNLCNKYSEGKVSMTH